MKLVLENKRLYLDHRKGTPLTYNSISLKTPYKESENELYVKINDLPFVKVNKVFSIPESEIKKKSIVITLKVKHKETLKTSLFKTDPITAQTVTHLGEGVRDKHASTLDALAARITELERKYKLLAQSVVEIGKQGEWL